MRRSATAGIFVALWCAAAAPLAWASLDDPPIVVAPGDPVGRSGQPSVDLGVHDAGSAAAPHRGSANRAGQTECTWVAAPEMEDFVRGLPARLPSPGQDRVNPRARLFQRVCDGVPGEFAWFAPASGAAALATPAGLARDAAAQLRLPAPTAGHSPALRLADGREAVLVGEHTWLWTSPERFDPRTRLLRLGPVWAQVTAQPVSLTFDPGNGDATVACSGAGTAYVPGRDGSHAASPTCDYRYGRSSAGRPGGVVAAVYAITWRVSWVGAVGAAPARGVLPDMTSRLTVPLVVAEAQAIGTAD